ncbi:MAG: ferrous iron transport protein A [Bdellovibrionaceae bacterium]|nr:ferrous iron transport protein A [Pseudobdellovibrionaceae bacterium]
MSSQNLANVPADFQGPIHGLSGDPILLARLRELGFIRGEWVVLKGRVGFGDPILVTIGNMTVALRRREAECVLV